MAISTDLAYEAHEAYKQSSPQVPGVDCEEGQREGFGVYRVRIKDSRGQEAIGKPVGNYITIELSELMRREDGAFE